MLQRVTGGPGAMALTLALFVLLFGQQARAAEGGDCRPAGGLSYLCGITNAEDLVLIPGTRWVVAGGLGTRDGVAPPGALRIIDTKAKTWTQPYPTWRQWYPDDLSNKGQAGAASPDCPGPPPPASSAYHGLGVRKTGPGRFRLYAVNHANIDRIEVFGVDTGGAAPSLKWLGCVPFITDPVGLKANSVASAPDGTLFVTVLERPGVKRADTLKGAITGGVYRWRPGDKAFSGVPGLDLSGPNGIEISADGRTLYELAFGAKTLVAFDLDDPAKPLWKAQVSGFWPDNVHWDDRGRLLVAGMNHNYDDCVDRPLGKLDKEPACVRTFNVAAIDPKTGQITPVVKGLTNPLYSNIATGLVVGDTVWLSEYRGDRVAYAPVGGKHAK